VTSAEVKGGDAGLGTAVRTQDTTLPSAAVFPRITEPDLLSANWELVFHFSLKKTPSIIGT